MIIYLNKIYSFYKIIH